MNLYLHFKCTFNAFKLFFTKSKAEHYSAYKRKVLHSSRHHTYSIKVTKPREPAGNLLVFYFL